MSDGEDGVGERLILENKIEIAQWRRRIRGKRNRPNVALEALTSVTALHDAQKKKKRSKFSKHSKKSWPKIDIKEIEEHEEEQRFDERVGHKVESLEDKDLFVIEKDLENEDVEKEDKVKSTRPKGKQLIDSLSCFRNMHLRSAVPPALQDNKKKVDMSLKDWQKIDAKAEKKAATIAKTSEDVSQSEKKDERKKWTKPISIPKFYDLWTEPENKDQEKEIDDPEIKELEEHQKRAIKRHIKPRPSRLNKKPNLIPAVEPPEPGISYNPSLLDHQNLLKKVLDREITDQKKEKRFENKILKYFPKGAKGYHILQKNYTLEMLGDLGSSEDEKEEEKEKAPKAKKPKKMKKKKQSTQESAEETPTSKTTEENEELEKVSSADPKRKTRVERNREKRKRAENIARLRKGRQKRKEAQIDRLDRIQKAIEEREKILEQRRQRRAQKYAEALYKPPKYLKEVDPTYQFTEEISGSLRTLKPAGSLLADRYKSLRRRNVFGTSRIKDKDHIEPKIIRKKMWKTFKLTNRRYKTRVAGDR